jgi:uncharacterized protein (TIGR03067 family)
MLLRFYFAALLAFVAITFTAHADDAKDAENIIGKWSVVRGERNGDALPEDQVKELKLTFGKEMLTLSSPEGEKEATVKLDPTKKPKTIDVIPKDGPRKGQLLRGIYELKGDELRLCMSDSEQSERPTEFKSPNGSSFVLLSLKRDK